KTRLGLQAAADSADRPGGVWWVELAPVRDPRHIPIAVLDAMGLAEDHHHTPIETMSEEFRDRPTLLVLDNCEHVIDGVTDLVRPLLDRARSLGGLATSREPIGLTGEVTWRVPSLPDDAATTLFVERARQARPGFAPDADQLEIVASICRQLDGLPLPI